MKLYWPCQAVGYRLPTVKELGQAESQEKGDGHWASATRTGGTGKDPTLSTSGVPGVTHNASQVLATAL